MTPPMTSSSQRPQVGHTPRRTRTELVRQSVLGILAEHGAPMSTQQLEAAHGHFGQYVYQQVRALERRGQTVRQRTVLASPRAVYWRLAGPIIDTCSINGCPSVGTAYAPAATTDKWIYHGSRAQWREITEIPNTGGWVCADPDHIELMLRHALQNARDLAATPQREGAAS
jgi:hypothetical protein